MKMQNKWFRLLTLAILTGLVSPMISYGMQSKSQFERFSELPIEVKAVLVSILSKGYDNVDDAIKAIQAVSRTNKELNKLVNEQYGKLSDQDLEIFTKIVHILADKFKQSTESISQYFKTPIAEKYRRLGEQLISAVRFGNREQIAQLIKQNADINFSIVIKNVSFSPLFMAILLESVELVKLLIDVGADVNQTNNQGGTPLLMASYHGYINIVKLLLNKNANINLALTADSTGDPQIKKGDTALQVAEKKGHADIVNLIKRKLEKSKRPAKAA